jgi:hypothetical protein
MKTTGSISINNIRTQELERNTDILSIGIISPATGGLSINPPLSVGPDLRVNAWVRLAFIIMPHFM